MNIFDLARLKLDPLLKYASVKDVDGMPVFTVDPGLIYPASIQDIQKTVSENKGWTEVIFLNDGARNFLPYLNLALIPKSKALEMDDVQQQTRAEMLELLRKWFTEKLHAFVGHIPIKIVINGSREWRL